MFLQAFRPYPPIGMITFARYLFISTLVIHMTHKEEFILSSCFQFVCMKICDVIKVIEFFVVIVDNMAINLQQPNIVEWTKSNV